MHVEGPQINSLEHMLQAKLDCLARKFIFVQKTLALDAKSLTPGQVSKEINTLKIVVREA